jgi:hypothetical protein
MKLFFMQLSPASRHILLLRAKYSPLHLFSNALHVYPFNGVRDQVSQPYKKDTIIILYVLIFTFLIGDDKTKDYEHNGSTHAPNLMCP